MMSPAHATTATHRNFHRSSMAKNSADVTVPKQCLTGLQELHAAKQQADREYTIALNSAALALGVDVSKNFTFNLSTGAIAPATVTDKSA